MRGGGTSENKPGPRVLFSAVMGGGEQVGRYTRWTPVRGRDYFCIATRSKNDLVFYD